jgi:hypothetical protein
MPAGMGRVNGTPGSLITSPNNLEQQANERAQAAANAAPTPPGTVQQQPYSLGNPGTGTNNAAAAAAGTANNPTAYPPTSSTYYYTPGVTPGSADGANRVAPGYAGTGEPGMRYTSVNPMGVTMPIGSYYSGLPVMPYRTTPTNSYSSMYVNPGYTATGTTYTYTNDAGTYLPRPRRGLFGGGLFGRRRAYQSYSYNPNTYNYATAPSTYYGAMPGTYSYGNTAPVMNYGAAPVTYYGTAPGTYTNGPVRY